MSSHKANSFWANGRKAYLKELQREEAEAVAVLGKKLKDATDPIVQDQIREQIAKVKQEYEEKLKASDTNLHFGSGS